MAHWIKLIFSFQLIFVIGFSARAESKKSFENGPKVEWTSHDQDSQGPQNQCPSVESCNDTDDEFNDDFDDEVLAVSTFLNFPSLLLEEYKAISQHPPGQPDLSLITPPPKN
jgi:hypothetical protein